MKWEELVGMARIGMMITPPLTNRMPSQPAGPLRPRRDSPLDDFIDLPLLRLEPAAGPRRIAAIAAALPSP